MTFDQAYAITVAITGGVGIGLCASMIVAICYMTGLRGWPLLRKILAALVGYHAWRFVWRLMRPQRQVGYRVVAQPSGVILWQSNGGAPTHSATAPEVARLTDGRHGSGAMQRR